MIDQETFNALKERMATSFPKIIDVYIEDSQKYVTEIDTALTTDQLDEIIHAAHSLKSSSGLLGIKEVFEQAKTLEHHVKDLKQSQGSVDAACQKTFKALEGAHREAISFLKQMSSS